MKFFSELFCFSVGVYKMFVILEKPWIFFPLSNDDPV